MTSTWTSLDAVQQNTIPQTFTFVLFLTMSLKGAKEVQTRTGLLGSPAPEGGHLSLAYVFVFSFLQAMHSLTTFFIILRPWTTQV